MDKKTPAIILNTNGLIFSLTNCRTGVINDAKQSKQNHDYVCFSACLLFSFYSFPVSARNYVGSKYFPIPNDGTSLFLGFGGVNCLDRLDILVFVLLYFEIMCKSNFLFSSSRSGNIYKSYCVTLGVTFLAGDKNLTDFRPTTRFRKVSKKSEIKMRCFMVVRFVSESRDKNSNLSTKRSFIFRSRHQERVSHVN